MAAPPLTPGLTPNGLDTPTAEIVAELRDESKEYNFSIEDARKHQQVIKPEQVSTSIPGTGLRKNLGVPAEHVDEEADKQNGSARPPHPNDSEHADHLPAAAKGDDDPNAVERASEQEGATGSGPGGHEQKLGLDMVEGQDEEDPIESKEEFFPDGQPMALSHEAAVFKDEMGRVTASMPGVKDQEPPGPRNEIELKPRIAELQFHTLNTDAGRTGPLLNITRDGEDEVVTNDPSELVGEGTLVEEGLGAAPPPVGNVEGWNDQGVVGHWRSAIGPGQDSTPMTDIRERHGHGRWHHEHEVKGNGHAKGKGKDKADGFVSEPSPLRQEAQTYADGTPIGSTAPANATPVTPTQRAGLSSADESGTGRPVRPSAVRRFTRMLPGRHQPHATQHTSTNAAPTITNEILMGGLPVMLLKTWLDRDEDGHRAVPVMMGNLRFRVGDSVSIRSGGKQTGREVFKIECEYGDGVIKWVVYRELRDFLSLHAHYKAANIGTGISHLRSSRRVQIPEFPRNSIPGWYRDKTSYKAVEKLDRHFEASEKPVENEKDQPPPPANSRQAGEWGAASRDALQQYLIDLIRAVMFRPESNRLCIFFELSALTVALAPRGGFQGKAGLIKLPSMDVSRKNTQPRILPHKWKQHRKPKWFIVRESYFVATEGPEETEIYDVFLLDPDFTIERPKRAYRKGLHLLSGTGGGTKAITNGDDRAPEDEYDEDDTDKNASRHTFYVSNSQRRVKLVARNARQMHQFIVSMERVAMQSIWSGRNRFDSFAPIRVNVAAQWLVDGRDYFWNLSRAINMAKSRIYIHDWWVSPEIYLRRPGDERYRLDNLLKRKAEEGVRIFLIIYNEVSAKTTPVESLYVKKKLTNLHPNIMLQRSPSHLPNGTFYWSHHEKLCVIDETIAFMGGLDLCFGRWDTSQHVLTDEDYTAQTGPDAPVWIGKDYWNERIAEFADLDKPFEDMFDRKKTARMPWHDVGLQLVGQPARDLCRHFIQRWNYLLRTKNHTRKMPFLLPPADFTERELIDLKLQGTCEVQICRSVGPWSMGTATKVEHSIQNAYVKSIQLSEHFVYIENQFFITSTVVDGIKIENGIGDALVQRIIRAHKHGEQWRACVVIPLLPGYTHPVDTPEGSSVRLILECQNRTICRGTHSIFTRLRKEGINPDDYIGFFSLRGWAKFNSGALTTEQVYIHGKTMIVDDRIVLCGSANINERSQRGDRDSELVAVVRDTDMIDGTMAGKPFKVGRYAHTLRMRLMREHVGVDVDAIEEDELMLRKPVADRKDIALWDPDNEQDDDQQRRGITRVKRSTPQARLRRTMVSAARSAGHGLMENRKNDLEKFAQKVRHPLAATLGDSGPSKDEGGDPSEHRDIGVDGQEIEGFASSVVPTLEEKTVAERRPDQTHSNGQPLFGLREDPDEDDAPEEATVGRKEEAQANELQYHPKERAPEKFGVPAKAPDADDVVPRKDDELLEAEKDDDIVQARKLLRKHLSAKVGADPWNMPTPTPIIDPNRFHDPLDKTFWNDMWVAVAVHNTQIFRKVFRCIPDDLITTWAQYKAFANHSDKFGRTEEAAEHGGDTKVTHDAGGSGGGTVGPAGGETKTNEAAGTNKGTAPHGRRGGDPDGIPGSGSLSGHLSAAMPGRGRSSSSASSNGGGGIPGIPTGAGDRSPLGDGSSSSSSSDDSEKEQEYKPSGEDEPWSQWELDMMEELLEEVRGHLVIYPTRFLEAEDMANNFLFNQERILPLLIFD